MNLCLIGCMYKDDIYSHHCYGLATALAKVTKSKINTVTSNCSCFSSSQTFGCTRDELLSIDCNPVKIPYAPPNPSMKYGKTKYYLAKFGKMHLYFEIARGVQFFLKTKKCDLIHFDQVLKAFGFLSLFTLLSLSRGRSRKIVVTVHELDPIQLKYKRLNRSYNTCAKIIVHSKDFKKELLDLGIEEKKIEIVHQGVQIGPLRNFNREQLIFFGGHKLLKGKGFDTLIDALEILVSKKRKLKIVIYTGEGCIGLDEGKKRVLQKGLLQFVTWSEFLQGDKLKDAFQKSLACIIPYTGGSGIYPAINAMANATPVIATRKASIPEYLGDLGIYIDQNAPDQLAEAIVDLMDHEYLVSSLGHKLRNLAKQRYSWENTAKKILGIYKKIGIASPEATNNRLEDSQNIC